MKKIYTSISAISIALCVFSFTNPVLAQAFHKGSFIMGVSEGSTVADYGSEGTIHPVVHEHIHGVRDPFTLEYGLTKHWGVGINSGGDIFMVNPNTFYGTDMFNSDAKAMTSEFTFDANYHFYVTKKIDLSVVGSLGNSSVTIKGTNNDQLYQYMVNGHIARLGLHAKYYFWKRIGVQAMWSLYSANNNSTKDIKGNTFGNGYSTSIKGKALEFGLVFRLGRLNRVSR